MAGVTVGDLLAVQREIASADWMDSIRSGDKWAGHAVAKVMGLNIDQPKDKERAKTCLRAWKGSGALIVERRKNANGDERSFLTVGEWALDG